MVALVLVAMAVIGVFAPHPAWPILNLNPTEAAISRDLGALAQFSANGADLRAPYSVRVELMSDQQAISPLEGAIRAGHEEVVQFLFHVAGPWSPDEATRLACVAVAAGRGDLVERLAPARPDLTQCPRP